MKEGHRIARSAGVVGLFTLMSRVLGLVRDSVVAALFPRSATDPFFVAFTIPNVLRQLLAEGALTGSFIPIFTEYRQRRGDDEARAMLDREADENTIPLDTTERYLYASLLAIYLEPEQKPERILETLGPDIIHECLAHVQDVVGGGAAKKRIARES